jgi:LysM repeat protein
MAAIGIVFLAFIFSAWQFTRSGRQMPSQLPVNIPKVPTPSAQSTNTKSSPQNCVGMLYVVQKNDTLEGIAQRFAVSEKEIMAMNNMRTERVNVPMKLMIPVCNSTPTGTVNPTIFSTIYTPSIRPITSTPAGG